MRVYQQIYWSSDSTAVVLVVNKKFLCSLIHKKKKKLTFPAAVWTSDFVTARAWAALMEPRLNHCVTAVSAAILKMNHGPCSLDLRNTSIIYWLKTKRRENLELWFEMWGENRQGQRQSLWCSMVCHLFAKTVFFFVPFSLSTYLTHTHSLSAGVWWSHEKQFHGRWAEPHQDLQLYDTQLAQVCRSHTRSQNWAPWRAAALVVALSVARHDNSASMRVAKSCWQWSGKQQILRGTANCQTMIGLKNKKRQVERKSKRLTLFRA